MMRCKFTLPELQEKLECPAEEPVLQMSLRTASVSSAPVPPLLGCFGTAPGGLSAIPVERSCANR